MPANWLSSIPLRYTPQKSNMKKIRFFVPVLILLAIACKKDSNNEMSNTPLPSPKDADGNVYKSVKIGNQIWMAENLKTTKLNDGTPITEYIFFNPNRSTFPWFSTTDPKMLFQWAPAIDLNNLHPDKLPFDYFGIYYNQFAIQSGKLAIPGWRIPTQQDFIVLRNFLASQGHAGNEATVLKSTIGWAGPFGNGSNLYGFDARPAGSTTATGSPDFQAAIARFATTDRNAANTTRKVASFVQNGALTFEDLSVQFGLNIRLIKE